MLCNTPYMNQSQVRAIVGARVSSVQGDEKTSHITQRSKGDAYAESQGWTVVGAFEDLDVSAIKLSPWERPDLKEWLTDRAEDWNALIFAKTDRVFRSAADCVKLAEWCREHHKILVLVDDGIRLDYYHPEDAKDAFAGAMSKVFLILASVFAEIEGQRFVQRARDRVAYLRNTDRWGYGLAPFGFQIVDHPTGKGKALAHDVEAQRVLHDAAARLLAGDSLTGIVAGFNKTGLLSPRDWYRATSGKAIKGTRWTVDNLKMILSNPTTQGMTTGTDRSVKRTVGKPILDSGGSPSVSGLRRLTLRHGSVFSPSWRSGPRTRASVGTRLTRCSVSPSARSAVRTCASSRRPPRLESRTGTTSAQTHRRVPRCRTSPPTRRNLSSKRSWNGTPAAG